MEENNNRRDGENQNNDRSNSEHNFGSERRDGDRPQNKKFYHEHRDDRHFDSDRPRRSFNHEDGDRPRRSFNHEDGDRPRRSFNHEDGDRPRRSFNHEDGDRPRRSFNHEDGDRPRRSFNHNDSDRPRRSFNHNDGDRPRRSFNHEDGDRPRRSFNHEDGDRPRRSFNHNDGDRPRRSFNHEDGDRPRRSFNHNDGDRPRRSFNHNDGDRPRRSFNHEDGDRPRRSFNHEDGDRPRRSFNHEDGDRRPRRSFSRNNDYSQRGPFFKGQLAPAEPSASKAQEPSRPTYYSKGLIRLNKYISNAGICSRRDADKLIEAGAVSVNGEVITQMGYLVKDGDLVVYGGETLKSEAKRYFLLNKPKGYITTLDDPQERETVMELVANACKERIYPVGRLDRNTTGLLLFTNDGEMSKKLTHPSTGVYKVYQVELDKAVTSEDMQKMLDGIELEDGEIKVDDVQYAVNVDQPVDYHTVGVQLHSGKNRIVRRIFESLGYTVQKLDRTVFAGLTKKDLPRGHFRELTEREVNFLKMV